MSETLVGEFQRIETNLEYFHWMKNYPSFSLGIGKQLLQLFLHSTLCLGHSKK